MKERGKYNPEKEKAEQYRKAIEDEFQIEPSAERVEELERELFKTIDQLEEQGIDYALAGGTGLDLADGKWDRDHHDLDVVIANKDREKFWNYYIERGYVITAPDRTEYDKDSFLAEDLHNAFLHGVEGGAAHEYEVMFQNELSGQVQSVSLQGRDVHLQPPEVNVFYKLRDGRRKDLNDIIQAIGVFDEDQRERLQELWEGHSMEMDGKIYTSIDAFIADAPVVDEKMRKKFFQSLESKKELFDEGLRVKADEVYEVAVNSSSGDDFINKLIEKYQGFMPERRALIESMTEFLFADDSLPKKEAFQEFVIDLVEKKDGNQFPHWYKYQFASEKIWEPK